MGGRASEALKAPGPEAAWKWNGNGRQTDSDVSMGQQSHDDGFLLSRNLHEFRITDIERTHAEQQTSL